jgi:hypothetical protein
VSARIEGFLAYGPNDLNPDDHLLLCREQSFILLCRLLFIMYAEDRRLLPYKLNRLYTENRSLGRIRDDIARRRDRAGSGLDEDFSRESTALWDDLETLFDVIDRGNARYGVAAYNGGLFDIEAHPFLTEKKLSDWHLARVIDHLGFAGVLVPCRGDCHQSLYRQQPRTRLQRRIGAGLLEAACHRKLSLRRGHQSLGRRVGQAGSVVGNRRRRSSAHFP